MKPSSLPRTSWQVSQPTHRAAERKPSAPAAREVLAITPARHRTSAIVQRIFFHRADPRRKASTTKPATMGQTRFMKAPALA